jgi:hypothetical protein
VIFDAIRECCKGILDGYCVDLRNARFVPISYVGYRTLPLLMWGTGMGDLINLNRFRKRAEKEQTARQADANRAKFGRSKSERTSEQKRQERASDALDQHRLDGGEAS